MKSVIVWFNNIMRATDSAELGTMALSAYFIAYLLFVPRYLVEQSMLYGAMTRYVPAWAWLIITTSLISMQAVSIFVGWLHFRRWTQLAIAVWWFLVGLAAVRSFLWLSPTPYLIWVTALTSFHSFIQKTIAEE